MMQILNNLKEIYYKSMNEEILNDLRDCNKCGFPIYFSNYDLAILIKYR